MVGADKKIVVLGSNAFSGQDFVDLVLAETDWRVLGVSRSPEKSSMFLRYRDRDDLERFQFHRMDMNGDMAALLDLLDAERPDYIVNFAAQSEVAPSWDTPEQWYQTNTVALAKLVNHLRSRDYLERYLHISSPEAYGDCQGRVTEDAPDNPSTPYAASKSAADQIVSVYQRQFGFPALSVRATNVYGARQQLFKIVVRSVLFIRSGKTIELHGGGKAVKSYMHVRDVSAGEFAVLQRGNIGERYHLSPDQGISIADLVSRIALAMGMNLDAVSKVVGERPGQDAAYVIDSSKARSTLGWAPAISIDEGIAEVIDWVDNHWTQLENEPWSYVHKP